MAKNDKSKGPVVKEDSGKYSIARVKEFSGEVKNEFNKIAWPDKKHTLGSTGVVVVLVMIISVYLGAVDLILGKLIGAILN